MAKKKKRSAEAVARRRARSAYKPAENALTREKDRAKDQYGEDQSQLDAIYQSLQDVLEPLYGRYDEAAQGIQSDYNAALGSLGSAFTPGFDAAAAIGGAVGDAANAGGNAALNAAMTMGAGGNTMLASEAARNNQYLTRMQMAGALGQKDSSLRLLDDYRDLVEDLRNRKLDLREQKSADRLALIDQIIAQRRQNRLQDRELDIAEQQFNKEFGLRKKEARHDNRQERRAQRTTEEYLTDEQAQKRLKRVNTRLGNVKGNLKTTNAAIDQYGGYTDPANRDYISDLEKKRQRLRKKKKTLKRRRRSLRNEVND